MTYNGLNWSETGSAGESRKPLVKFGSNKEIEFVPGWYIHLSTGVVRFNTATNEVSTYLNFHIFTVTEVRDDSRYTKTRFVGTAYTSEEFEQLMDELTSLSPEELDAKFPVTV